MSAIPAQAQLALFRDARAAHDLSDLAAALDRFHRDMGRYPTNQEGLDVLTHPTPELQAGGRYPAAAYLSKLPIDPWGNPYHYLQPGIKTDRGYDVWSYGADGKPGGLGENEDVGNWSGSSQDYLRKARNTRWLFYISAGFWVSALSLVISLPAYVLRVAARRREGQGRRQAMLGAELLRLVVASGLVFVMATWWTSLSMYVD